jgi:hypothetical protein
MWPRVRKELGIFLASFVAVVILFVLEVFYVVTMGKFIFLTGIPTFGGAPLYIHVQNMGLKGAYAALAYTLVMRVWFGKIALTRVALLWGIGLCGIAALGQAAMSGVLSIGAANNLGLIVFFVIGQFLARDWVSR